MRAGGPADQQGFEDKFGRAPGLALKALGEQFDLYDPGLDGDAETLNIAGGMLKRRWQELGQLGGWGAEEDLDLKLVGSGCPMMPRRCCGPRPTCASPCISQGCPWAYQGIG